MLNPLACHVSTGKAMQLAIDDGHQFFQRVLVALTPGEEQLCHFRHCSVWFSDAIIAPQFPSARLSSTARISLV